MEDDYTKLSNLEELKFIWRKGADSQKTMKKYYGRILSTGRLLVLFKGFDIGS